MRATSAGMRAAAMVGAAALAAGLAVAVPTAAGAADLPGPNVGTEGASQGPTTTLTGVPDGATAPKAESKTWYANGFWWASMKNPLGDGYTIHRLANRDTGGTPTWVNTAIGIDPRNNTSADALYDAESGFLFVSSHEMAKVNTDTTASDVILTRYSYNAGSWIRDWRITTPVNRKVTSFAITKASDDHIVGVYMRSGQPWIVRTSVATGATAPTTQSHFRLRWSKNTLLVADDLAATQATRDDTADIVSSEGWVTVVFSNQNTTNNAQGFYVARNRTGDRWGTGNFYGSQLTSAPFSADNHISLVPSPSGTANSAIYAAVKTSYDQETPTIDPSKPLLRLFKIVPRTGGTVAGANNSGYADLPGANITTLSTVAEKGTRPVAAYDTSRNRIDVFYSAPGDPAATTNVQGVIFRESVNPSTMSIVGGRDVVMLDTARQGTTANKPDGLNDATVSQGFVNASTGTIVLATHRAITTTPSSTTVARTYWWNDVSVPTANFDFAPAADDTNALKVDFTSLSTRRPGTYSWNFGDGGSSSSANPTHTFGSSGAKTVTLTVTNDWGTDSVTKTINVGVAPTAAFTTKRMGTTILGAVFTDTSTGLVDTVSYNFGDGWSKTVPGGTSFSHRYARAGTYTVVQTATNAAGSTTKTVRLVINAAPAKMAAPKVSSRTGRKVLVTWVAPANNGRAIQKYQIICRPTAGAGLRSRIVGYKYRSAYVTNLVKGKTYSCTVRAYNLVGWGTLSNRSVFFKARA